MLNFYDFEVYKYDWLVVIIRPTSREVTVIANDLEQLRRYFTEHRNEIWIGFNSGHYDKYIMKALLTGENPKNVSDWIVKHKRKGWEYSRKFNKITMYDYDVKLFNDGSLKKLEGFRGIDIRETSVPFDIDRKLTSAEIELTIKYCRHDVEQTMWVFAERVKDFKAHLLLIKYFKLPLSCISKTQTQLTACILNAQKQEHDDEFDFFFPKNLKLKKYRHVYDWYKNSKQRCIDKMKAQYEEAVDDEERLKFDWTNKESFRDYFYNEKLTLNIAGVNSVFGWGGIHSAKKKYHGKGIFVNIDVASLYPSIMLVYNLFSRNVSNKELYRYIYDERLRHKHSGGLLNYPFKNVLNKTYGATKDKNNALYDPLMANEICIFGQLLLLDLIEKLEDSCEIIQANTDGILIRLYNYDDYDLIDDIVYKWEKRTGLTMEFDEEIKEVFQKDVNNYLTISLSGKVKRKGSYLKKSSSIDNDLPIVKTAMINYMVDGIEVEDTIRNCKDLMQFQKIFVVSHKYEGAWHNGEYLKERCFRTFASKCESDTPLKKYKNDKDNLDCFGVHKVFIINDDVSEMSIPDTLDVDWYINAARKRLEGFGGVLTC